MELEVELKIRNISMTFEQYFKSCINEDSIHNVSENITALKCFPHL
jgi:hypothetical protein